MNAMMGSELSDSLIEQACQGDAAAIASVAQVLLPHVRLMVAARLGMDSQGGGNIDDLAQVAISEMTEALPRLQTRTVGGLRAFTSAIVSHKVADHLRDPRRRSDRRPVSLDSTVALLTEAGPLWQFLSASGASPLSMAARAESVSRVVAELRGLKPEHREVITLAFFDQLKTAEIAERMSITRPAATMLLTRALAALRQRVGEPQTQA